MKTVIIRGGLGNQLFGLAFADTVAHISGEPVRLDLSSYENDPHGRVFETADLARDSGLDMSAGDPPQPPSLLRKIFPRPPVRILEPSTPVAAGSLAPMIHKGEVFDGYWQNARWFDRPDFIREQTRVFLDRLGGGAARHDVVIHHRIYNEERLAHRNGVPAGSYFKGALDELDMVFGPVTDIALISNSPELREGHLGQYRHSTTRYIGAPEADMALMLNARLLVLSNSSFSWWGGFCSDAKAVIYPRQNHYFHYPIPPPSFRLVK